MANFLDFIILLIGTLSIFIIGIMPIYFVVKYKTLGALAYWDYGTKKEKTIIKVGYIGLLIYAVLIVVSSVLNNFVL